MHDTIKTTGYRRLLFYKKNGESLGNAAPDQSSDEENEILEATTRAYKLNKDLVPCIKYSSRTSSRFDLSCLSASIAIVKSNFSFSEEEYE